MKKLVFYSILLCMLVVFTGKVAAQTDTLIKPDRPRTYTDPKITPENDKVLLDTNTHVVDSLLDTKKSGRKPVTRPKTNPMGEADKPIRLKRAPGDTSKVRP